MIILFIDDLRESKNYVTEKNYNVIITARNYADAIDWLSNNGWVDIVYFDHDLGEDKTGYDIAKYIVENKIKLKGFKIHSSNPVGRFNIRQLLEHYGYRYLN